MNRLLFKVSDNSSAGESDNNYYPVESVASDNSDERPSKCPASRSFVSDEYPKPSASHGECAEHDHDADTA